MPTRFLRIVRRKMNSFVTKLSCRRSNPDDTVAIEEEESKEIVGQNSSRYENREYDESDEETWCEYESDSPFHSYVDTYAFDRKMEKKYSLRKNFLAQCKVKPAQRKIIMDWFMDTFDRLKQFEMVPDVLHLAVAIFDRYIQQEKKVLGKNLELVAVASLFVAVKMEDGLSTRVKIKDGIFLTGDKYGHAEIREMERTVLKTLGFHVIIPSSYHFLSRCHFIMKSLELEVFFGMYMLEVVLLSYDTCHIRPSLQAAAAYVITRVFMTNGEDWSINWPKKLEKHTGYTVSDLGPVVQQISRQVYEISTNGPKSKVFNKYYCGKFFAVSRFIANSKPILKKLMKRHDPNFKN